MSQIEQNIRAFLSKNPEIEKCMQSNIINRRSLARYLIENGVAEKNRLEALIAVLRRLEVKRYEKQEMGLFKRVRIRVKDNIAILDFEKDKRLIQETKKIIDSASYDKEETLKIVVGSASIKVFIDESNRAAVRKLLQNFKLNNEHKNISEISMLFPETALETKGILSFISRELYLNDILISEFLTASPELLIYLKEEYVVKAYEVIKRVQK